jgi:hypothetical protein
LSSALFLLYSLYIPTAYFTIGTPYQNFGS